MKDNILQISAIIAVSMIGIGIAFTHIPDDRTEKNITSDEALETARSDIADDWVLNRSEFDEGVHEFYFKNRSSEAQVEVSSDGRLVETEINRESDNLTDFEINRSSARRIADQQLSDDSWKLNQTLEDEEGVYKFNYLNGNLSAQIEVDGSSGRVIEREEEFVPESEVEESEEDTGDDEEGEIEDDEPVPEENS